MKPISMKVTHEVQALASGRAFNFYITDEIKPDGQRFNWNTYEYERVESTTSQRYFIEHLADVKPGDVVNLYINSMGGSVKEALGIYNLLRRCGATVNAYIDGFAASAASVIAMAAHRVVMPKNTTMMVHNAAWGVYGNSAALRKSADDLDILNAAMLQSYVVKAGDKLTMEKLEELTDGETWLSAEDCILYGLADEFAEQEADLAPAAKLYQQAHAEDLRQPAARLPAAMAAAIAALDPDPAPAQHNPVAGAAPIPAAPHAPENQKTSCMKSIFAAIIK